MRRLLVLLFVLASPAWAQVNNPSRLDLKEEGASQGRIFSLDCIGTELLCAVSNGAGTITFSGANLLPFSDATALVKDNADATKLLRFEVSGVTTGNTVAPEWAGTGAGLLRIGAGTAGGPAYAFSGDSTSGVWSPAAGLLGLSANTATRVAMTSASFIFGSNILLKWASGTDPVNTSADVGIERLAVSVIRPTTTPVTWIQQTPGRSTLAANYTNATTTFSNTALSITVISGRKYTFRVALFASDSVAADGVKIDFNGGSAAATDFRAHCRVYDTALLLSAQVTALATAISQATITGSGVIECSGTFEPSGAGTFILRAAQVAHTSGTLTIARGSHIWVEDCP